MITANQISEYFQEAINSVDELAETPADVRNMFRELRDRLILANSENEKIKTREITVGKIMILTRPTTFILYDNDGNVFAEPIFPAGTRVMVDYINFDDPELALSLSIPLVPNALASGASWESVRIVDPEKD